MTTLESIRYAIHLSSLEASCLYAVAAAHDWWLSSRISIPPSFDILAKGQGYLLPNAPRALGGALYVQMNVTAESPALNELSKNLSTQGSLNAHAATWAYISAVFQIVTNLC